MLKKLLLIIVILVLVGGLSFFGYKKIYANSGQRQAVFLTNGQVYFGYVSKSGMPLVTVKDVYYLKTNDLTSTDKKKIMLVKMGNELHSPENEMTINRDQILFIQNLRGESKINDAISKFSQTAQQ